MKKSNKLLLGGFLTVILLIAAIHITLYAKYKSGNYTIYQPLHKRSDIMQSFPHIKYVTLRNVDGIYVQFADTAEVERGKDDFIQYVQQGDSLVITGKDDDGLPDGRRLVNISVPSNAALSAFNSFLYVEKSRKATPTDVMIYLQKSHILFLAHENPFELGHVTIAASDSSIASFLGKTQVAHLEARLTNSALDYNKSNTGQLSIITDSMSRISLASKHLLKAKITVTPDNP